MAILGPVHWTVPTQVYGENYLGRNRLHIRLSEGVLVGVRRTIQRCPLRVVLEQPHGFRVLL